MADYTLKVRIDKEAMISDYLKAMKAVKDKSKHDDNLVHYKIVADEKEFFNSVKKMFSEAGLLKHDIKVGIDDEYYKKSLNKLEGYTNKGVKEIRNSIGKGFSDVEKYDLKNVIDGRLSHNKVKNKIMELRDDINSSMQSIDISDYKQVDALLEKVRVLQSMTEQISKNGKHKDYGDIWGKDLTKSSIEELINNVKSQYSQAMALNRDKYVSQMQSEMKGNVDYIQNMFKKVLENLFDETGKLRTQISENVSSGIQDGVNQGEKSIEQLEHDLKKLKETETSLGEGKGDSKKQDRADAAFVKLDDSFREGKEIEQGDIDEYVESITDYLKTLSKNSKEYKEIVKEYNEISEGLELEGKNLPAISSMETYEDVLHRVHTEQQRISQSISELRSKQASEEGNNNPQGINTNINVENEAALKAINQVKDSLDKLPRTKSIDILLNGLQNGELQKSILGWSSADNQLAELDVPLNERLALFNSKTGFMSNSYIYDAQGEISEEIIKAAVESAQGQADSMIHTHGIYNVAAFTPEDVSNAITALNDNITKQYVMGLNEVSVLDLSSVSKKDMLKIEKEFDAKFKEIQNEALNSLSGTDVEKNLGAQALSMSDEFQNKVKNALTDVIKNIGLNPDDIYKTFSISDFVNSIQSNKIPEIEIAVKGKLSPDFDSDIQDQLDNITPKPIIKVVPEVVDDDQIKKNKSLKNNESKLKISNQKSDNEIQKNVIDDSLIEEEKGKLEYLRDLLGDIKKAIQDKTAEFKNESEQVDGFVDSEVASLQKIQDALGDIDDKIKNSILSLQNSDDTKIILTPELTKGYYEEIQQLLTNKTFKIKLSPELTTSFVKTAQKKLDEAGGLKVKSYEEEKALDNAATEFVENITGGLNVSKKTAQALKEEIKSIVNVVQTGGVADSKGIIDILGGDEQYLRKRFSQVWDEYKKVRDYISKSKIRLLDDDIAELGDDRKRFEGKFGFGVLSTSEGVEALTVLKELNNILPITSEEITTNQDALRVMYDYLDNPPNLKDLLNAEMYQDNGAIIDYYNEKITTLANTLNTQSQYYQHNLELFDNYLNELRSKMQEELRLYQSRNSEIDKAINNSNVNNDNVTNTNKTVQPPTVNALDEMVKFALKEDDSSLQDVIYKHIDMIISAFDEAGKDIKKANADWFNSLITSGSGLSDIENVKNHIKNINQDTQSSKASDSFKQEEKVLEQCVNAEIQSLQKLKASIQEVIDKIDLKTRAFKEEQQVVDGVVQGEMTSLDSLSGTLILLKESVDKFQDDLKGINLNISINEDATKVTSFMSKLSKIDDVKIESKLTNIYGKLSNFVDSLNGLKINDDNILSSINNILSKSKELQNLVTVLKTSKKKINEAQKVVKEKEQPKQEVSNIDKAIEQYNRLYDAQIKLTKIEPGTNEPLVHYYVEEIKKAREEIESLILTEEEAANVSEKTAKKEADAANATYETNRKRDESFQKAIKSAENLQATVKKQASSMMSNGKLMSAFGDQVREAVEKIDNINIITNPTEAISQLRDLQNELKNIASTAEMAGKSGKTLGQIFAQRFKSLIAYLGTFVQFYDMIRYTRQAFETIQELDYQLVDLRKTTTMTTSELNNFYNSSANIAKQLGVTSSEIISQAAAWSRLGYSSQEAATQMAQLSSKFATVSPGMTTEQSTDYLVSTMQAYGVAVDDVERKIMDNVNRIGNTFATTNAEIGEMLTRSSAAMKAANNSLEETIALESAAVEITRNAETTGTAFRTVSMRIRGLDEETEEALEDYDELKGKIADLTKTEKTPGGVSLFTDASKTEYKSTYQFLKDISEIWDDLTDKNQAALLEAIGGKRGAQSLAGILSDFSEVERAMSEMEGAAGSAEAEMGIVQESISFKLNALKQEWVETLTQITDRGEIGNVIDGLTKISEGLGFIIDKLGVFKTAIVGVMTVIGSQKLGILNTDDTSTIFGALNYRGQMRQSRKEAKEYKNILSNLKETSDPEASFFAHDFLELDNYSDNVKNKLHEIQQAAIETGKSGEEAFGEIEVEMEAAEGEATKLGDQLKNVGVSILNGIASAAISAAIAAVVQSVINFIKSDELLAEKTQEIANNFNQQKTQLSEYSGEIIKLQGVLDDSTSTTEEVKSATSDLYKIQRELINQYPAYASQIDVVNGKLEKQLDVLQKINQRNAQDALNEIDATKSDKVRLTNASSYLAASTHPATQMLAFESFIMKFIKNINEGQGIGDSFDSSLFGSDIFGKDYGTKVYGSSSQQIKERVQKYNREFTTDNETVLRLAQNYEDAFKVQNGTIQTVGSIYDVNKAVVELQIQLKELGVTDEEVFNNLSSWAGETSGDIDKFGSQYGTVIEGEILSTRELSENYDDLTEKYNQYLEAQASGDTEAVEKIGQEYVELFDSISKSGIEDQYLDYFKSMYPEMESLISSWQFEVDIIPKLQMKKGLEEDIQRHSADDLKKRYDNWRVNPEGGDAVTRGRFKALEESAAEMGYTVYQFIDYMKASPKYSDATQKLRELMGKDFDQAFADELAEKGQLEAVLDIKPKKDGLKYAKEEILSELNPIEVEVKPKASDLVEDLKDVESDLTGVHTIYDTATKGEIVKASDIEGVTSAFGGIGKDAETGEWNAMSSSLENYNKQLVENPKNVEAVKKANNEVTTSYLDLSGNLDKLIDKDAKYAEEVLKQQRIENAEEVVQSRLNKTYKATRQNLEDLAEMVAEYSDALANSNKTAEEFDPKNGAFKDITQQVSQLLGEYDQTTGELKNPADIDGQFMADNWEKVEDAIHGVDGAVDELYIKLAEANARKIMISAGMDTSEIENNMTGISEMLAIASTWKMEPQALLDNSQFMAALKASYDGTQASVDAINAALGTIGMKVQYKTTPRKLIVPTNQATAANSLGTNTYKGGKSTMVYWKPEEMTVDDFEIVATQTGKGTVGKGARVGGGTNTGGGGTGGGNANEGDTKNGIKEDDKQVFDWIEVKIQRLTEAIERLGKKANNTFLNWKKRTKAVGDEIDKVTDRINAEKKAEDEYLKYARSISNTSKNKNNWVDKAPDVKDYEKGKDDKQYKYDKAQYDEANRIWKNGRKSDGKKYQKLIEEGLLGKYDIERIQNKYLVNLINGYQEWYNKAVQMKDAIIDDEIELSNLNKQNFDNLTTQLEEVNALLEKQVELIDKRIARTEQKGFFVDESYYKDQIALAEKEIENVQNTLNKHVAQLNLQLALGEADEGKGGIDFESTEWNAMVQQIMDDNLQLEELNNHIIELYDNIKKVEWERFSWLEDRLKRINAEADHIIKFVSVNDMFEKNGNFKNTGWANAALVAAQYNNAFAEAERYAAEYNEWKAKMDDDKYVAASWDNKEDVEHLEELKDGWWSAKEALIDYMQAMKSLVEEAINKHLEHLQEVINKYKEALSSAKDLYDWQKNITDQTKQIESLEKQLRAVQGDDSESARKRRQELTNQLESAQQQLQETEWDRYISQTGEMLDDLYEDYEEILNARLDDIVDLMGDMITAINNNTGNVQEGIITMLQQFGIDTGQLEYFKSFTEKNGKDLVSAINDGKFANTNTTISDTLKSTQKYIEDIADTASKISKVLDGSSDIVYDSKTGKVSVVERTSSNNNNKNNNNNGITSIVSASNDKTKQEKQIEKIQKELDTYKRINATKHDQIIKKGNKKTAADDRWLKEYNDTIAKYYAKINKIKLGKLPKDLITGIKSAYAKGSRKIPHDQLAWTQEEGSEVIFRKSDGAMLTPLGQGDMVFTNEMSKTLWAIAKGGIPTNANIIVPDIAGNRNTTVTANNEITITLPNVQDYASFKHDLQNDDNFEKFIQEVTIGQVWGNNKLNKRKY